MALAIEETERLTAQEKFRTIKERAIVEVKIVSRIGTPPAWIRARVKETNRGGAFCRTEKGKDGFYHWSEVRPCPDIDPRDDKHKPFATLGEVMHGGLRAVPPFIDTLPPKPPPPPPEATKPEVKPVLLMTHDEIKNGGPMQSDGKAKRQRHIHQITPIANLFRAERLKRGWSQGELADHISDTSKTLLVLGDQISQFELGKKAPTDEILIAFASVCGVSLDTIHKAQNEREPLPVQSAPPAPVVSAPAVYRPEPSVMTPYAAPPITRQDTPPPDYQEKLLLFTDNLMGLAPPPLDRDLRGEWFRLASRLYQLSRA